MYLLDSCYLLTLSSAINKEIQLAKSIQLLMKTDLCLVTPSTGHRQLHSIQFCLVLLPPSSSTCTWSPLATFISPDLFPGVPGLPSSSVALTCPLQCLLGDAVSMCVQASSILFFLAAHAPVLCHFSSIATCWIFCLASAYLRSLIGICW